MVTTNCVKRRARRSKVNTVLTFDLHRWSLICMVSLHGVFVDVLFNVPLFSFCCVTSVFLLLLFILVLWWCVFVFFGGGIFCGLWFMFWLWFCLGLEGLGWCGAFRFWASFLLFCWVFVLGLLQQTHHTNEQTRRKKLVFFQVWEAFWGEVWQKNRPQKINVIVFFYPKILLSFLSFPLFLSLSSFCFSSLISLSFSSSPFLLSFLEMLKGSFEEQRYPNNPSLLSLFFWFLWKSFIAFPFPSRCF